jgi:hypothetical protein
VRIGAMHESHQQARGENIFAMKYEKLISGCEKSSPISFQVDLSIMFSYDTSIIDGG